MTRYAFLFLVLSVLGGCIKANPEFNPDKYIDEYMNEKGVVTQKDLSGEGTIQAVSDYLDGKGILTRKDLTEYATKNDLEDYVSQRDLDSRGFLTQADITNDGVVIVPNAFQAGTRLQSKSGRTDDGARMFLGWYDRTLEVDCDFVNTTEGSRCLPLNDRPSNTTPGNTKFPEVIQMFYFSDRDCNLPIFQYKDLTVPAPGILQDTSLYGFSWGNARLQIEKAYKLEDCDGATILFEKKDSYCVIVSVECDPRVYKIGRPVPLSDFVGMSVVLETATE
jgi:hypothetical protein